MSTYYRLYCPLCQERINFVQVGDIVTGMGIPFDEICSWMTLHRAHLTRLSIVSEVDDQFWGVPPDAG